MTRHAKKKTKKNEHTAYMMINQSVETDPKLTHNVS